jgi:hypothetical protein
MHYRQHVRRAFAGQFPKTRFKENAMQKWILPLAVAASLSACGMMGTDSAENQGGEITSGGGANNEVLGPTNESPAEWPDDKRPYKNNGSSGSGSIESGTSGGTSNERLGPTNESPAEWPDDKRPYQNNGSSGSGSIEPGTSGGTSNERLGPTNESPAEWPDDKRPYQNNGSSGSGSMEGQTSGSSGPDAAVILDDPAPEIIIVEPIESAPSSSGSSESVTTGTGGASGSDTREPNERTPGEWPTDQRPYVEGQK